MNENELVTLVLDKAYMIHRELGPGFFESVYEQILCDMLVMDGLQVKQQVLLPVTFRDRTYRFGFKADLIIDQKVIVELKSIESLHPVHFKQLLNYLRAADMKLGLLINFNEQFLKNGIKRVVNGAL